MAVAAISVLVPTFRRVDSFRRCLDALERQTATPTEVVVVVRDDDHESRVVVEAITSPLSLRVATVSGSGQVQALNCGLSVVRTQLVAITDDDTQPHEDWLERIVMHFADPCVGAVGGRDIIYMDGKLVGGKANAVGCVRWYGRIVGNHHLQSEQQEVQFLKGANMSFRREVLPGFDEHLAGEGSQPCNDMQASLRVHRDGWRVVWDPDVAVDHFPAERLDEDKRLNPTRRAVCNGIHNQTYVVLSLLSGRRRFITFMYLLLVGTRAEPGVIMLPMAIVARGPGQSMFGFSANLEGRLRGLARYLSARGMPRIPPEAPSPLGAVVPLAAAPSGTRGNGDPP